MPFKRQAASSKFTEEFIPPKGGNVDGTRILKNWGGSNWNFYMNDPDGKTIAINLEPYSQDEVYNVWAPQTGSSTGNDNVGQVRYTYGPYSYYYYLKNHLGNIQMVLNSSGAVDSYNDYYPFGEQMPGRNGAGSADGRYKYISVEQDAETGLYATGPRLYDPWSGRFFGADTMASDSALAPWSPYQYSFDNPVRFEDPTGKWPDWGSLGAAVSSWFASEQAQLGSWARNALGAGGTNSEQIQAEGDYHNSDPGIPTNAEVDQKQAQAGSEFLYANGLADMKATSFTLSLSGTGAVFEGAAGASVALGLSSSVVSIGFNAITGKDQTTAYVSAGLTLATWGAGRTGLISPVVSKTISVAKTTYNYFSTFSQK